MRPCDNTNIPTEIPDADFESDSLHRYSIEAQLKAKIQEVNLLKQQLQLLVQLDRPKQAPIGLPEERELGEYSMQSIERRQIQNDQHKISHVLMTDGTDSDCDLSLRDIDENLTCVNPMTLDQADRTGFIQENIGINQ